MGPWHAKDHRELLQRLSVLDDSNYAILVSPNGHRYFRRNLNDPAERQLGVSEPSSAHVANTRLGLRLFAVYSLFYLAFSLTGAFAPQVADWKPAGGVNIAIWSGFGLIALAFVLALSYGLMCRPTSVELKRLPEASRNDKPVEESLR